MSRSGRPERWLVEAVMAEEAEAAGLKLAEVLHSGAALPSRIRRRAMRRIKASSGCTADGLAAVFGCDRKDVLQALHEVLPRPPGPAPAGFRVPAIPQHSLAAALTCLVAIEDYQHRGTR